MKFSELYAGNEKIVSLEFFPPRATDSLAATIALIEDLDRLNPHYMTVTYGAGGGNRSLTRELVGHIQNNLGRTAVAHITCAGHSTEELLGVIEEFRADGISNFLALRGDPPKGTHSFVPHPQGLNCAKDLVSLMKRCGDLSIAVAGYPETHREARSPQADIEYLKQKVDAGAEVIITQLFFEPRLYFDFLDRARAIGIEVPIVPGIMPIANAAQVRRFTDMCGATIPPLLQRKLHALEERPEELLEFGIEYALELCEQLLAGGAPGVHLYTLNRSTQVRPILEHLKKRLIA